MNKLKNSLIMQFAALIFLIAVILLGSVLGINYMEYYVMRKNTVQANEKMMEQTAGEMEQFCNNLKNQITAMSYSPTVTKYFDADALERIMEFEELENVFTNTMMIQENIIGISIFDADLQKIASVGVDMQEECEYGLVDTLKISDAKASERVSGTYCFLYYPIYELEYNSSSRQKGMVVFMISADAFAGLLEDKQITAHTQILLLDRMDSIVAAKGSKAAEYSAEEGEDAFYTMEKELDVTGWRLVYHIPKDEFVSNMDQLMIFSRMSYSMVAVLLLVLILYVYWCVMRPIYRVDQFIKDHPSHPDRRVEQMKNNEIGRLAESLNRMLDVKEEMNRHMRESSEKMYQIEIARNQMEILAYRSQINPHFLYNTLECIRGLAFYHDALDIAEISINLSEVFRYAIKGDAWTSLKDELYHVEKYAKIIEYRFGGRISVELSADEELRDVRVIRLLLQPIVENAVFHGLEPKVGNGKVSVCVRRQEPDGMLIVVEDNGIGMTKEALMTLRERLSCASRGDIGEGEHIGLANVCRRLWLYYADRAEMTVDSEWNEGTKFVLHLPVERGTPVDKEGRRKNE